MVPRVAFLLGLILHITQVSSFSDSWKYAPSRKSCPNFALRSVDLSKESVSHDEATEQRNLRFAGVGRLYTPPPSDDSMENSHLQVVDRLAQATVVVVGLGGVGSWSAEALCRSGIGNLVLIDLDDICISNTNRQMHAMSSTVGKFKIDEMARRFKDINPDCNITLIHDFVSADNVDGFLTSISGVTACLDAIDGTKGKSALIAACARHQIPVSGALQL
jgi:tRNA A37 threonylcarbamoyladenosine dehydratase